MNNNSKQSVISAIAETQDGKQLKGVDDFSKFILARIDANSTSNDSPAVEVSDLITDFKYMISQLSNALKPLQTFERNQY